MLTCFGRNISPSSGGCVDLTRFFGYGGSLTPSSGGGTADAAGGLGGPYSLTHELGCIQVRGVK